MLGVLPIFNGCLEPLMLRTKARPSLPFYATYFYVPIFYQSFSRVGL